MGYDQALSLFELAVREAEKCQPEDERIHPHVGVVVEKNGSVLAVAYRGELKAGDHAEFTALESKLSTESLVGATIYTTLEPCTTRNHPKVPCARRLIERGVRRVYIGLLDTNRKIQGNGVAALQEAKTAVELFPEEFVARIREMNRDFIRYHTDLKEDEPQPPTIVAGEHSASGIGDVTGLEIEGSEPVHLMPGTRSSASGFGNVTGTRITTRFGGKEK